MDRGHRGTHPNARSEFADGIGITIDGCGIGVGAIFDPYDLGTCSGCSIIPQSDVWQRDSTGNGLSTREWTDRIRSHSGQSIHGPLIPTRRVSKGLQSQPDASARDIHPNPTRQRGTAQSPPAASTRDTSIPTRRVSEGPLIPTRRVSEGRLEATATADDNITMPDPLAFFITWPAYGTWLPGDDRSLSIDRLKAYSWG